MNLMHDNNQNQNSSKNDNEMELAFGKPWNFTEIKDKSEQENSKNEMDTIEIKSDASEERDMINKGEEMMKMMMNNSNTDETAQIHDKLILVSDLKTVLGAVKDLAGVKNKKPLRNRYFVAASEIKGEPRFMQKKFWEKLTEIENNLKLQLGIIKQGGSLGENFSEEERTMGDDLKEWHRKWFTQEFIKVMYEKKELVDQSMLGLILNEYNELDDEKKIKDPLLKTDSSLPEWYQEDNSKEMDEKKTIDENAGGALRGQNAVEVSQAWKEKLKADGVLLQDLIKIWSQINVTLCNKQHKNKPKDLGKTRKPSCVTFYNAK